MSNKLIKKEVKDLVPIDLIQGDKVIDDRGNIYSVGKINLKKKEVELLYDGNNHYGTINFRELDERYLKIDKTEEELFDEAISTLKSLNNLPEESIENTTTTALVNFNKEYVQTINNQLEEKRKKFEILERILERKRSEIQSVIHALAEKIEKCQKILTTIELYLGVSEDIIILQEGQKASTTEPICLRQSLLYMDEELGAWEDGGLDFENIEDFDTWLTTNKNYEKLLPEQKGVVVLRVRRYDKDYGDLGINLYANEFNRWTYFLIRNGENIYRIWADIQVRDNLFPSQEELQELMENLKNDSSYEKEKAETKYFTYTDIFMVLQGLIDRTQIFHPLKNQINLFNIATLGDSVKFIYDEKAILTEGRELYSEWREKINKAITQGSRIFFSRFELGEFSGQGYESWGHRFPFNAWHKPNAGIYIVHKIEPSNYDSIKYICRFNPKDTVYKRWESHERKKAISFYLYPHDKNFLNYDRISLEDAQYYIQNRYERQNYLTTLPVLYGIRRKRLEEIKWEKGFVENLKLRISLDDKEKLEEIIWKSINWWKYKVKWKRPLTKDDAKALRMITKKVKKEVAEMA